MHSSFAFPLNALPHSAVEKGEGEGATRPFVAKSAHAIFCTAKRFWPLLGVGKRTLFFALGER